MLCTMCPGEENPRGQADTRRITERVCKTGRWTRTGDKNCLAKRTTSRRKLWTAAMANYRAATRDCLAKKHPGAAPHDLHSKWMNGSREGHSPDILDINGPCRIEPSDPHPLVVASATS